MSGLYRVCVGVVCGLCLAIFIVAAMAIHHVLEQLLTPATKRQLGRVLARNGLAGVDETLSCLAGPDCVEQRRVADAMFELAQRHECVVVALMYSYRFFVAAQLHAATDGRHSRDVDDEVVWIVTRAIMTAATSQRPGFHFTRSVRRDLIRVARRRRQRAQREELRGDGFDTEAESLVDRINTYTVLELLDWLTSEVGRDRATLIVETRLFGEPVSPAAATNCERVRRSRMRKDAEDYLAKRWVNPAAGLADIVLRRADQAAA